MSSDYRKAKKRRMRFRNLVRKVCRAIGDYADAAYPFRRFVDMTAQGKFGDAASLEAFKDLRP